MSDPHEDMNRQIDIEQQRARMQRIIRDCQCGVLVALSEDGELVSAYMNLNPIERRGLGEILRDMGPKFSPAYEGEDDGED